MSTMFDALQTFMAESASLLQEMEHGLLIMEDDATDKEAINAVFRAAHTIKGSAGLFGLDDIVGFTHHVETLLDQVRNEALVLCSEQISLLLKCRDHMQHLLQLGIDNKPLPAALIAEGQRLIVALAQDAVPEVVTESAIALAPALGRWHLSIRFGQDTFRNGMEPSSFLKYLNSLGQITSLKTQFMLPAPDAVFDAESCYLAFDVLFNGVTTADELEAVFEFVRDDCQLEIHVVNQEQQAVVAAVTAAAKANDTTVSPTANNLIRINAEKLDHLINLVGELVISTAGVHLLANRNQDAALSEASSEAAHLVEEIRESAMRLRMVEIGESFSRFKRVVRDLSKDLGKDIRLELSGEDTELDKSIVEQIGDPLTHLIRNALDHGIERSDVRIAAGKPASGTLKLNAYHESLSLIHI